MNKKYKQTFSAIYPSDKAIERVMEMTKEKDKKSKKANRISTMAVAIACLAVFVTGVLAGNVPKGNQTPALTSESSISGKTAPGFAIIAYADDTKTKFDKKNYEIKTPLKSKIGAVDIRGKSNKETDAIVKELYRKYNLTDWDFPCYESEDKNVLTFLDTNNTIYDNAIIYQYRNGFFDLDLPEEAVKTVKEIRVKNTNRDAYVLITTLDAYYNPDGTLKENYKMYAKSTGRTNIDFENDEIPYAVLSGESYKKDRALEKKHGKRMFGISWVIGNGLIEKINQDPNYDFSQISDKLTIEVEFEDGNVSQSVVKIATDKEGYIFAKPEAFEYIANKN